MQVFRNASLLYFEPVIFQIICIFQKVENIWCLNTWRSGNLEFINSNILEMITHEFKNSKTNIDSMKSRSRL